MLTQEQKDQWVEQMGQSFYNFGIALGKVVTNLVTSIQSIDWEGLQRAIDAVNLKSTQCCYRKHSRPQLTTEDYATKSNNWLRMHGYAPRRKKRR